MFQLQVKSIYLYLIFFTKVLFCSDQYQIVVPVRDFKITALPLCCLPELSQWIMIILKFHFSGLQGVSGAGG